MKKTFTMTNWSLIPLALILLTALSCSQEMSPAEGDETAAAAANPVSFANLQVGQASTYVRQANTRGSQTYEPTGDTLTLRVVEKNADGSFTLEENLRAASEEYQQATQQQRYQVEVRNDSLFLTGGDMTGSYLFDRLGQTLPLRELAENRVQALDFEVQLPQDSISGVFAPGFMREARVQDKIYEHLNVVKDISAMAFDGNGTAFFYSAEDGLVQSIIYNGMSGTGSRWQLVSGQSAVGSGQ